MFFKFTLFSKISRFYSSNTYKRINYDNIMKIIEEKEDKALAILKCINILKLIMRQYRSNNDGYLFF